MQLRGADGKGVMGGMGVMGIIDAATALEVLRSRDIDERGTTRIDREILEALNEAGGPLGLATLADRIGVSRRDLLRVYEPFLVRRGLITRTRRGRVL